MKSLFQKLISTYRQRWLKNQQKKKNPLRNLRAPLAFNVEIASGDQSFSAVTNDVAIGGVSFNSPENLVAGRKLNLGLFVPTVKGVKRLQAEGKIAWSRSSEEGWTVGVAFTDFDEAHKATLRNTLMAYVQNDTRVRFKISDAASKEEE